MGNFREIKGDLIEMFNWGDLDVIAHGCNCYATFGAGIALTIGKTFPEAKDADLYQDLPEGEPRLGKFTSADIILESFDVGMIYNLYTQLNPGRDFRMSAFKKAIKAMREDLENQYNEDPHDIKIGFPLIGCGIAGGDWKKVRKVIQEEFKDFDVTVVHFTEQVEGVNYWPKKLIK